MEDVDKSIRVIEREIAALIKAGASRARLRGRRIALSELEKLKNRQSKS